jgi:AcrR family transcriptional regulator
LSGITARLRLRMAEREVPVTDRRTRRTRRSLHEALASLVREKPYDVISVKEILDRANVGRSTFYAHFSDKDELLASTIRDMLGAARSSRAQASAAWYEQLIAFSLPIFEHIHDHRDAHAGPMDATDRTVLHGHLQKILVESIGERVRSELPRLRIERARVPAEVLTQYIASTFILVFNWWLESRSRMSPKEVDAVFRALVLPALVTL